MLILDEPTAVLTPQESRDLFATLRQLVNEGLSIIFISHKLDEVLAVSDRIAVLRNGRLVATRAALGATKGELAELMVGRAVVMPTRERRAAGATVVAIDGVRARDDRGNGLLDGVDLTVAAGEIVAIAALRHTAAGAGEVCGNTRRNLRQLGGRALRRSRVRARRGSRADSEIASGRRDRISRLEKSFGESDNRVHRADSSPRGGPGPCGNGAEFRCAGFAINVRRDRLGPTTCKS